jgi:hypothetical protein
MKILECSSIGDKRFSALYAKVKAFNKVDTIENHYQLAKVFDGHYQGSHWSDIKGKKSKVKEMTLTGIRLNGIDYNLKFLSQWYSLLWLRFLDKRPEHVKFLSQFDDFSDVFKGKGTENCQADVIRKYIKQGRESIIEECKELISILKGT